MFVGEIHLFDYIRTRPLVMAFVLENERRRHELYSLDRNILARSIKDKMGQSHVLTSGEYNFNADQSKDGLWKTSTETDFRVRIEYDPQVMRGSDPVLV